MSKPTPASVARIAFLPGMTVIENGRRPPCAGVDAVNLSESAPVLLSTSHEATNPGVGGTPLTEAKSCAPFSLKMTCETVPGGPVAGVVWLRFSERWVLSIWMSPSLGSCLKQLFE